MQENRLKPLPSRGNLVPSLLQPLPGVRVANRRCCMAFTGAAFLQGLNTCVLCDSSSFSYAGVPETAGQSLFGKAAHFLLIVFPELLFHKKPSDVRRETQTNVASSAWLPTLQIMLTDVQDKLSSSSHKNPATEICTIPSETHRTTTLWGFLDLYLNKYSKALGLNAGPIF